MPPPRASSHCSKRRSAPAAGPTGPLPALRSSPSSRPSTTASGCGGIQSGATSPRWRPDSDTRKNTPSQRKHRVSSITGKLHYDIGGDAEAVVSGHLGALIPGQGPLQLGGRVLTG